MKTQARTVENALTLKRADALAVGDIIPGGNAAKGHVVTHVSHGRIDDMLGMVTLVVVRQIPMDEEFHAARDYTFRPYDKIWVEA